MLTVDADATDFGGEMDDDVGFVCYQSADVGEVRKVVILLC